MTRAWIDVARLNMTWTWLHVRLNMTWTRLGVYRLRIVARDTFVVLVFVVDDRPNNSDTQKRRNGAVNIILVSPRRSCTKCCDGNGRRRDNSNKFAIHNVDPSLGLDTGKRRIRGKQERSGINVGFGAKTGNNSPLLSNSSHPARHEILNNTA